MQKNGRGGGFSRFVYRKAINAFGVKNAKLCFVFWACSVYRRDCPLRRGLCQRPQGSISLDLCSMNCVGDKI